MKRRGENQCRYVLLLVLLLGLMPLVATESEGARIIGNSQDWRDVYSVMIYSNIVGDSSSFLVSQRHAPLILNSIPKGTQILAVSSADRPYIVGYKSFLESRGYPAEEIVVEEANLELAKRLTDVKNFVVIDDSYGYNAVSVGPYASVSKSFVLFADEDNIDDVVNFLLDIDPEQVLIYGIVDRAVRDGLSQFDPEIINDGGDRFRNNVGIVRKYQEIAPKKQVILTNGEFLEQELVSGVEPVLFLGQQNVPDITRDYMQEAGFEVAVLIGNQYVGSATSIRRSTGVSVFVKFAQSARNPAGPISPVEGLDIFYLPLVILNLEIFSVEYNQATGMLEVTLRNNVEQATYFKGTYNIRSGDESQTVGDVDAVFIDGNSFITMTYPIDPIVENAYVDAFVIFGESKFSLERTLEGRYNITFVKVFDESALEIIDVYYDAPNKRFVVVVKNVGDVDLFTDVVISDIMINDILQEIGTGAEPVLIRAGETVKVFIPAELDDEDIAANEEINIIARYGQRPTGLVKTAKATFKMKVKTVDYVYYGLIAFIVFLILIIFVTRKKKCDECKHKNHRKRKTCEKCGSRL